jgi:predicted PurR-regulated permease PerM
MDPPIDAGNSGDSAEVAAAEAPAATGSSTGLNVAAGIVAMVALVAALSLAHAFFIPLLIGILASYALRPLVDWLKAVYVPRFIGAALVLVALSASMIWVAIAVSGQAAAMLEKLPDAARQFRQHLIDTRTDTPGVLENMQEAAKELQAAADAAGVTKTAPKSRLIVAREPEIPSWLRDYVLGQSGLVLSVAAQAPIVLLLTYFLLASGGHFRRKLVRLVGPSLSRKKDAVRILEGISQQVQRYLLANLVANTLVGVGTWLAFLALGVEQAGAWGVAAGILHFIPYLGPALTALASGVVAFVQFGSPLTALAVAGTSLLVAGSIGFGFMTWLQSRFAHVNAAVLFIALLFFGWLWGVWGLLLGAPLVAIAKVICDHVDALKPIGEMLGS